MLHLQHRAQRQNSTPAVCCGVPALTVASLLLQDRAPAQHSEGGGCVCVGGGGVAAGRGGMTKDGK